MTLKDIETRINSSNDKYNKLAVEKAAEDKKAEDYEAAALKAAQDNDLDAYRRNRDLANEARDRSFVLGAQLNKRNNGVSDDEILAAYDDYLRDYEKRFKAFKKRLDDVRSDYGKIIMEGIDLQNEALRTREKVGKMISSDKPESYTRGEDCFLSVKLPALMDNVSYDTNLRTTTFSADAMCAAIINGFKFNDPALDKLHAVLRLHRAFWGD